MDDKDQAKVMFKMDKAGESLKDWNVWWHSHSTMGVFWSGTDNNTILEHANNGGYLISIVTNKEGKFKTRIDIFPKDVSPFGIVTYYKAADDIETEILPEIHDPVRRKELASILNVKIDKVEADIKEIEEEYKTKIGEITKELQDEKASLVQKIEFAYDTDNVELEEEYSRLSGSTLIENQILRDEIDKEVEEKVTTPAVVIDYGAYKGKNWWRDKKHSERNFGKNKGLDKFFGIDAGSAFEQLDRIKDRIDPRTENYPHQEYLPSIVK